MVPCFEEIRFRRKCPDPFWGPPNLLFCGYRRYWQWRVVGHSLSSGAEIESEWIFTSASRIRLDAVDIAFRANAVPLMPTSHAAPLPCSDSGVSFVKVRVVAGNIRTASPTV